MSKLVLFLVLTANAMTQLANRLKDEVLLELLSTNALPNKPSDSKEIKEFLSTNAKVYLNETKGTPEALKVSFVNSLTQPERSLFLATVVEYGDASHAKLVAQLLCKETGMSYDNLSFILNLLKPTSSTEVDQAVEDTPADIQPIDFTAPPKKSLISFKK